MLLCFACPILPVLGLTYLVIHRLFERTYEGSSPAPDRASIEVTVCLGPSFAGWYDYPEKPGHTRYWSGSMWLGKPKKDVLPTKNRVADALPVLVGVNPEHRGPFAFDR